MMPSASLLVGFASLFFCLAVVAPPYLILVPDLLLSIFPSQWEVSGVQIDLRDAAFGAIALGVLLRWGPRWAAAAKHIPRLGLWIAYGVLVSLAYLNSPTTKVYLLGLLEAAYQLYRYCWKPLMYYPLVALILSGPQARNTVLVTLVIATDIFALVGVLQGYAGVEAIGTLGEIGQKNTFASALLIPILLSLKGCMEPGSRRWRLFHLISAALLIRGLLIAGSRSAFVGGTVGIALFFLGAASVPGMRRRIVRLVGAAAFIVVMLFSWNPRLDARPALQYTLSARRLAADDSFKWRVQERWPHFWEMMLERPWLGWGTDVDTDLGSAANTPHNAFLSLAVSQGIPAMVLFASFVFFGIRDGFKNYRFAIAPEERLLGLAVATSTIALTINSMADGGLFLPIVVTPFWLVVAIAALDERKRSSLRRKARSRVRSVERRFASGIPVG